MAGERRGAFHLIFMAVHEAQAFISSPGNTDFLKKAFRGFSEAVFFSVEYRRPMAKVPNSLAQNTSLKP